MIAVMDAMTNTDKRHLGISAGKADRDMTDDAKPRHDGKSKDTCICNACLVQGIDAITSLNKVAMQEISRRAGGPIITRLTAMGNISRAVHR
jgi:hypothetical protein